MSHLRVLFVEVDLPTILIVDDISSNRQFLVTLLRSHGHRLLEAGDGLEALVTVHAEPPDLVITDVLMPVMDGYEFVRQLRLDPMTRQIPVVFYTAHYGEREARALALSLGVSDILTKPAGSNAVLEIVGRALRGPSEAELPPGSSVSLADLDREHLRLLTDKLSDTAGDLRAANARLRALINIGLELAAERDSDRLLQLMCAAALDLFGATYVSLGIVDHNDLIVQRFVTSGTDVPHWIETGETLSGALRTVVAERRTLLGENPTGDPIKLQLPLLHPAVQSFLAVPIASLAQVYGWICLVSNEGRTFENDVDMVLALAGQVGRIYELEHEITERKRAEDEIRQRAELSALGAAIGLSLTAADSLQDALQRCTEALVTHLRAAFARIWTLNEGEGVLELQASAGLYTHLNGPHGKVPLGELEIGRIARDRQPHLTNAVIDDPRVDDQEWARREGMVAFAGHPLVVAGRVVGVMALFARHPLSEAVIAALASVADHIALGIERHRGAEALRTAEERMRYALQSAGVGIWDMDYTTGVLRWSEILEAQYGLPAGTFNQTFESFIEHVHPDERAALFGTIGNAMKSGSDFATQHRVIWPDGDVRWLSGAGRIFLGEHGEPVRGVGISLDITERRTLEDQYQQAQKMEAIGRLAGSVAHDFNNLLTAILGYCDLLMGDLDPNDPRQADVVEIQKAGTRGADLTRQLLAFSRKQVIEPTLLDLNVVVADMQSMLRRLIGEDVTIELALRSELARVMADRGQVEQIVMNLAVNARDAMPGGGTLTIETDDVQLDEHYTKTHHAVIPGPFVALTISDTGTGIPANVKAHLFEPFFTTKEPGKGTGLGLATVHGIVARSGGTVAVYTEAGMGTSFRVYLPRVDAPQTPIEVPPTVPQSTPTTETVLVVEDAEEIRKLARRLLQLQGYTVLTAANANEARREFQRNASIDVIVTDIVMPGDSGPELIRQLLRDHPALKVIYMSGYTEETIVRHGVLKPGFAFLHKPFTAETLVRKIRDVLDQ